MNIDTSEIARFLEGVCRNSNHRTADFWRQYWFETGHYRRLLLQIEKLEPVLQTRPRLLDIGSFGEFPLILLKFFQLPVLYANSFEGDVIAYGGGRLLQTGDQGVELAFIIEQRDVEKRAMSQADESLDVVTCYEVLEHLRHDPMFMMLEIHRVLREDGLLILSTPNANSWEALARVAALESPFIFSSYFVDGSGIGHCKEYSVSEIRRLFDNAGFTIEKIETFDAVAPDPDLEAKLRGLKAYLQGNEWWDPELRGQTLLVQARKSGPPRARKYTPLYTGEVPCASRDGEVQKHAARLQEIVAEQQKEARRLENEAQQLRDRIIALQAEFEDRSRWALELDQQATETRECISRLQEELDDRGRWALGLDREVEAQRETINGLQHRLHEMEKQLSSRRFLVGQLMRRLR
jgi:SAM-dependent methyltransferase